MRILKSLFVFLLAQGAWAQSIAPTQSFTISGDVKEAVTFSLDDLKKIPSVALGTVIITNHLGEKKSEARDIKGILLRDLFKKVEINTESPKVLSEYYVVCKATDG